MNACPLRVLLVEDESFVAMLLEDLCEELGCQSVLAAPNVPTALRLLEREAVDVAILDVNLGGTMSTPVADELEARAIPFIFVTGYGQAGVPVAHRHRLALQKPFRLKELEAALTQLRAIVQGQRGDATGSPPAGRNTTCAEGDRARR